MVVFGQLKERQRAVEEREEGIERKLHGGKPCLCSRPQPLLQKTPKKKLLTAARARRRVTPDDASRLTCARVTGRGGRIEGGFCREPEGVERDEEGKNRPLSSQCFFFSSRE